MPLQATSGVATYDAFGGGVATAANYIEDVFQTWLYNGNGSTQTITNGVDLAGKGGLVWLKRRDAVSNHNLFDTARGATKKLYSDLTNAEFTDVTSLTSFNSNGFSLGLDGGGNANGGTYASWTFREQPKFFDVVTYTGNGASQNIAHNLDSVPGCMIIKRTDSTSDWFVYHRSLTNTQYMRLNTTGAIASSGVIWDSTTPTSTQFTLGASTANASGATYVAYLFAHNAGGFGSTETDNVISCGSGTTPSSGNLTVNLGFEPQWILWKNTAQYGWSIADVNRGMALTGSTQDLEANTSAAERTPGLLYWPTATGFEVSGPAVGQNVNFIYIAIRRGPMRTPTTGTSVFAPALASSSGTYTATSNFPVDWAIEGDRASTTKFFAGTRLTGDNTLQPNTAGAESAQSWGFANMTGFTLPGVVGNYSGFINWMMRRAPGFFDVVCYTGTGSARTVAHNLGVAPELMIVKDRSSTQGWSVYAQPLGATNALVLQTTAAVDTGTSRWNSTTPTSTVFSLGSSSFVNANTQTFVAYLFASVSGVSKVGSYTGTGTTQTINCGFTAGSRFVMIKRTDDVGDWYVWDSARGIVAGNDPYLLLNSTAAEVTSTDYVDTAATGFELSSTAPAALNANGGTYIFLAIA